MKILKVDSLKRVVFSALLVISLLNNAACDSVGDQEYLKYYDKGQKSIDSLKIERAVGYLNKSIELNPNFNKSYLLRASAYIEQGEYEKAEKDLDKVLNGKPSDYDLDAANYIKFSFYSKQKNRQKAFEYLDKAFGAKREFSRIHSNGLAKGYIEFYSESLIKNQNLKEAEKVLLKATDYFSDYYPYYSFLAYIAERYHQDDKMAIFYLEKARELSNGKITQDPKDTLKNIKKTDLTISNKQ